MQRIVPQQLLASTDVPPGDQKPFAVGQVIDWVTHQVRCLQPHHLHVRFLGGTTVAKSAPSNVGHIVENWKRQRISIDLQSGDVDPSQANCVRFFESFSPRIHTVFLVKLFNVHPLNDNVALFINTMPIVKHERSTFLEVFKGFTATSTLVDAQPNVHFPSWHGAHALAPFWKFVNDETVMILSASFGSKVLFIEDIKAGCISITIILRRKAMRAIKEMPRVNTNPDFVHVCKHLGLQVTTIQVIPDLLCILRKSGACGFDLRTSENSNCIR